ncbi:MAG: hypothetical protein RIB98_16335 [Acidimicrobiales bacterium]
MTDENLTKWLDDLEADGRTMADVTTVESAMGIPRARLYEWRALDRGPLSIRLGGKVQYPIAALRKWLLESAERSSRGGVT